MREIDRLQLNTFQIYETRINNNNSRRKISRTNGFFLSFVKTDFQDSVDFERDFWAW